MNSAKRGRGDSNSVFPATFAVNHAFHLQPLLRLKQSSHVIEIYRFCNEIAIRFLPGFPILVEAYTFGIDFRASPSEL